MQSGHFLKPMFRTFLSLVALCWAAVGLAEDHFSVKCPSPSGRFAMRITEPAEGENAEVKIELIEKTSGKVTADLGTACARHLSETVLVWSADSKWVAYATRGEREGETSVYFWNGLAFDQIPLAIAGLLTASAPLTVADVSSISPDKKWEFTGGDEPKIVQASTNELALVNILQKQQKHHAQDHFRRHRFIASPAVGMRYLPTDKT
jgi:hypothetical protein